MFGCKWLERQKNTVHSFELDHCGHLQTHKQVAEQYIFTLRNYLVTLMSLDFGVRYVLNASSKYLNVAHLRVENESAI